MITIVYWDLNNCSVLVEDPLVPSLLVTSVLCYPWMVNFIFKLRMIPSHIFMLPLPAMLLPNLLKLRSICKLSLMKIKFWLLPQSFFSFGTTRLVIETCSPSNTCFAMLIHSPLPSLQDLKNVKCPNARHVNMQSLTDIPQRGPLPLVNLIPIVILKPHTLVLGITYP